MTGKRGVQRTLLALAITTCFAACSFLSTVQPQTDGIELYGWLTQADGQQYLELWITNRGPKPQTVLTENYSLSRTRVNGHRLPIVEVSYRLLGIEAADSGEKWSFVPSLSKLAPVTLRKDETASLSIELDQELVEVLCNPETEVTVEYSIGKDIADRFGLWHGKLELQETKCPKCSAVLVVVSSMTALNHHFRYVLPSVGFVFVFLGSAVLLMRSSKAMGGFSSSGPWGLRAPGCCANKLLT